MTLSDLSAPGSAYQRGSRQPAGRLDKLLWHYCRNGQQTGPVNLAELREMIASDVLHGDTLVWQAGMTRWVKVRLHQDLLAWIPLAAASPAASQPSRFNSVLAILRKGIRGIRK